MTWATRDRVDLHASLAFLFGRSKDWLWDTHCSIKTNKQTNKQYNNNNNNNSNLQRSAIIDQIYEYSETPTQEKLYFSNRSNR
jgi:hypothetical protein